MKKVVIAIIFGFTRFGDYLGIRTANRSLPQTQ
jgi:hypothetical protein